MIIALDVSEKQITTTGQRNPRVIICGDRASDRASIHVVDRVTPSKMHCTGHSGIELLRLELWVRDLRHQQILTDR